MSKLTHLDEDGRASMVDVSQKAVSKRRAVASAVVSMNRETLRLIESNGISKGDVLNTARIAGIQAAKRCDELIPLCHSLPLDSVQLSFDSDANLPGVRVIAEVVVTARTGVEMEALTAASVAALTIYDMCKAVDKSIVIGPTQLEKKEGGRSGTWTRAEPTAEARR
ncbi:MAG: cyclic pyranopterin monophosphate synthase MoaC [Pseudomonadota bacterium]